MRLKRTGRGRARCQLTLLAMGGSRQMAVDLLCNHPEMRAGALKLHRISTIFSQHQLNTIFRTLGGHRVVTVRRNALVGRPKEPVVTISGARLEPAARPGPARLGG
jgi:hypothetical protein